MSTRPEWLYGPETRKNSRNRYMIAAFAAMIAFLALIIITGCKSTGEPKPAPLANKSAPAKAPKVKAPDVPETVGTSVSVTLYDWGTVVPIDPSKLPGEDCWYEINPKDLDQKPGGAKMVEVKAICP